MFAMQNNTKYAIEAIRRGYTPIPVMTGAKRPYGTSWQHTRYEDTPEGREKARADFERAAADGYGEIGLLLGKPSGGLVDVDLDHELATRLQEYLLPPTDMATGRSGHRWSHRWYVATDNLMDTRQFKLPSGASLVEYRSTGGQSVIPPSVYPGGGQYSWDGEAGAWGGDEGPAVVDGRKLLVQVTLLALAAVLIENWPKRGGRHEAYLALAGGLLRRGDGVVHDWWERNLPILISAIAEATHDEDGPRTRVAETVQSTARRIREGKPALGFPKLAEHIGEPHADQARRWARDIESLAGYAPEAATPLASAPTTAAVPGSPAQSAGAEGRNPLEERASSWEALDLEPYLTGSVVMPEPTVLRRDDGKGLFYSGRVNSLYGRSESAKSWIALYACHQEMSRGERVVYLDFEDEPVGTITRLRAIGAGDDDLVRQFRYVHPEGPIAAMQRSRYGSTATDEGMDGEIALAALLDAFDPTLIVADGMTVIYGLHGLDTNDAVGTDIVTSWLKGLTRRGRTTVIVIDHTGKAGGAGSSPIGAHHKIAMVQGTALRADAIDRPMPGAVGTINLAVFKDRPGAVRAISSQAAADSEQIAAVVTMDSTEEGVTRMSVSAPDPDVVTVGGSDAQAKKLADLAQAQARSQAVLDLFGGDLDKRLRTVDVTSTLGITTQEVYPIWKLLETSGDVRAHGGRRLRHYRLVDPAEDYAPPGDAGDTDDTQ